MYLYQGHTTSMHWYSPDQQQYQSTKDLSAQKHQWLNMWNATSRKERPLEHFKLYLFKRCTGTNNALNFDILWAVYLKYTTAYQFKGKIRLRRLSSSNDQRFKEMQKPNLSSAKGMHASGWIYKQIKTSDQFTWHFLFPLMRNNFFLKEWKKKYHQDEDNWERERENKNKTEHWTVSYAKWHIKPLNHNHLLSPCW